MTKWTSVKDGLPNHYGDVAVLLNNQLTAIAFCLPEHNSWFLVQPINIQSLPIPDGYRVTHWAELPELPEELK